MGQSGVDLSSGNIDHVVHCSARERSLTLSHCHIMSAHLSLLLSTVVCGCVALDLGYGGLPGQRTARTGSVWPPYPGANQGYWARRAGFYKSLSGFSGTSAAGTAATAVTAETTTGLSLTSPVTTPPFTNTASNLVSRQYPNNLVSITQVPVYNQYNLLLNKAYP